MLRPSRRSRPPAPAARSMHSTIEALPASKRPREVMRGKQACRVPRHEGSKVHVPAHRALQRRARPWTCWCHRTATCTLLHILESREVLRDGSAARARFMETPRPYRAWNAMISGSGRVSAWNPPGASSAAVHAFVTSNFKLHDLNYTISAQSVTASVSA